MNDSKGCTCYNLFIATLLLICLSGCYSTRVATQAQPGSEISSKTVHSFFWGLLQKPRTVSTPNCDSLGSKGLAQVTIKNNFGYSLITVITLGIWSPTRVEWQCGKPCQRSGELGGGIDDPVKNSNLPLFPWPPPDFSVRSVLNRSYFKNARTLGDVNSVLEKVLDPLNYTDRSYYYIPNGFALVTRIEQIAEDGQSFNAPERWSVKVSQMKNLSFSSYLKALLFPPSGYFRIIVFTVTDQPFKSSGKPVNENAAMAWLQNGLNVLPKQISEAPFDSAYNCTVLIYEFKKIPSADAKLLAPGTLTGDDHLNRSQIKKLLINQ